MAEHAHTTAAPDVVRLNGSSSTTGTPPTFEAVATAADSQLAAVALSVPDADLFAMIASHAVAVAAATEAEAVLNEARARFDSAEPERPRAILYRFDDPAEMPEGREKSPNGYRLLYTKADIEKLRETPRLMTLSSGPVESSEGPGMAWRTDPRRVARRAEILDAFDAWYRDRMAVAEQVGWTSARAEATRLSEEVRWIEDAILGHQTRSLAGIGRKALWIEEQDKVEQWAGFIFYDVLSLDSEYDSVGVVEHSRVA